MAFIIYYTASLRTVGGLNLYCMHGNPLTAGRWCDNF